MSARENLTLGRADATDAEIEEALDVAQAGFVRDTDLIRDNRSSFGEEETMEPDITETTTMTSTRIGRRP